MIIIIFLLQLLRPACAIIISSSLLPQIAFLTGSINSHNKSHNFKQRFSGLHQMLHLLIAINGKSLEWCLSCQILPLILKIQLNTLLILTYNVILYNHLLAFQGRENSGKESPWKHKFVINSTFISHLHLTSERRLEIRSNKMYR